MEWYSFCQVHREKILRGVSSMFKNTKSISLDPSWNGILFIVLYLSGIVDVENFQCKFGQTVQAGLTREVKKEQREY